MECKECQAYPPSQECGECPKYLADEEEYPKEKEMAAMEQLIKLNETLDSLIDVSHDAYMSTPESDVENRARLDGHIRAYWNVKDVVENMIKVEP